MGGCPQQEIGGVLAGYGAKAVTSRHRSLTITKGPIVTHPAKTIDSATSLPGRLDGQDDVRCR
jgi:hypothetical protein